MIDITHWNGYRRSSFRKFWHELTFILESSFTSLRCSFLLYKWESDHITPNVSLTLTFYGTAISWVWCNLVIEQLFLDKLWGAQIFQNINNIDQERTVWNSEESSSMYYLSLLQWRWLNLSGSLLGPQSEFTVRFLWPGERASVQLDFGNSISKDWKQQGSPCLSPLLSIRLFSPPIECFPANCREHGHWEFKLVSHSFRAQEGLSITLSCLTWKQNLGERFLLAHPWLMRCPTLDQSLWSVKWVR